MQNKESIQNLLMNKVFFVDSEKDWRKLLLCLSYYCRVMTYESYKECYPFFKPVYIRINSIFNEKGLLQTGWGDKKDTEYYQGYIQETNLEYWFNIL